MYTCYQKYNSVLLCCRDSIPQIVDMFMAVPRRFVNDILVQRVRLLLLNLKLNLKVKSSCVKAPHFVQKRQQERTKKKMSIHQDPSLLPKLNPKDIFCRLNLGGDGHAKGNAVSDHILIRLDSILCVTTSGSNWKACRLKSLQRDS